MDAKEILNRESDISLRVSVDILIQLARGIGSDYSGSIRRGYSLRFSNNKYKLKYKPYWSDAEHVPSNLATYMLYKKGTLLYKRIAKIKHDDGGYMGNRVQHKLDINIKDNNVFMRIVLVLKDCMETAA